MRILLLGAAALLAADATAAELDVFKCTTREGAVTYQPLPCPLSSVEKRIEMPPFSAGFDPSEGGNVFKREAEMDRRRAEAAKQPQQETESVRQAAVAEFPNINGQAGAPTLPPGSSNQVQHQSSVATAPSRRR
jgi:hypothetical protein